MLNYSQLRCFIKIVEYLSYKQVSAELCISTTVVSKQIKNLENQISERLFFRNTRNVQLITFGIIMFDKCQSLLKEGK
ncbi:MAG: LysR family transcriptional regulator [Francisella endosymbiont of Hyalomma scupense]